MPSPSGGAPDPVISSVSGTIQHGQTITINGSGFGTRGDYHSHSNSGLAWAWQDFESGALNSYGWIADTNYLGIVQWDIQTTGGRGGASTYWARRYSNDSPADNQGGYKKIYSDAAPTSTYFLSFWHYDPRSAGESSGKITRSRFLNDVELWHSSSGGVVYRSSGAYTNVPAVTYAWHRFDILLEGAGTPFRQRLWQIGAAGSGGAFNAPAFDDSYAIPILSPWEPNMGAGKDYAPPGGGKEWRFDDIYVDLTQARIEIANTSTWAARTQCEIQIPLTWATGQVQAQVNRGAFGATASAYIYVVDSAGLVNTNGFPITFGGGPVVPTAPTNLRVVP